MINIRLLESFKLVLGASRSIVLLSWRHVKVLNRETETDKQITYLTNVHSHTWTQLIIINSDIKRIPRAKKMRSALFSDLDQHLWFGFDIYEIPVVQM